jgi:membrane-bound serine protease (ClpP class)
MLFEGGGVSLKLILPTVVFVGGFFVVVAGLAFKAHRSKPIGGSEGLIGEIGAVKETLDPEGLIFIHGEYWNARAREKVEPGEKVEVESMDGLLLNVKKVE